jgi:twitching motility protein PilT
MISAFPSDIHNSVAAQLADSLAGVMCQRLHSREDLGIRLPECEVLRPPAAVKNHIRRQEFEQIGSAIETGAENGMWTFARYREWMAKRNDWFLPAFSLNHRPSHRFPNERLEGFLLCLEGWHDSDRAVPRPQEC